MTRPYEGDPGKGQGAGTESARRYRVNYSFRDADGFPCTRSEEIVAQSGAEAMEQIRAARLGEPLRFNNVNMIETELPRRKKKFAQYVVFAFGLLMLAQLVLSQM